MQINRETGAAELTVRSKRYGTFIVLVDVEDWERVNAFTWHVQKQKNCIYFRTMVRNTDGRQTKMKLHRFVANVTDPKIKVDHIHHDYMDCRKSELRVCTNAENVRNARRRRDNTSGYKGVYWHKGAGKYATQIQVNGKNKYLGCRDSKEEAAKLYDAASREHFGEFALTNFSEVAA